MTFSIKDFFSKCDQIRSFLLIWSHLLKKSLMENFIFFCSISIYWLKTYDVEKIQPAANSEQIIKLVST